MKPEIASIHDRMAKGGDWSAFRDEIAALHAEAITEEEHVTLLDAHRNLVSVAKFAFDEETYKKLLPIAESEYRTFLSSEATEDGSINPLLMERITRREVEAGRLHPEDSLRKLAVAGATVLGDTVALDAHRCKQGDWFFYGMAAAAVLSVGLARASVSPLWLVAVGLAAGWALNEQERKRIDSAIVKRRADGSRNLR